MTFIPPESVEFMCKSDVAVEVGAARRQKIVEQQWAVLATYASAANGLLVILLVFNPL